MKRLIPIFLFILWGVVAFSETVLDASISGSFDFGYMVVPDSGTSTSTVPANSSGIVVSFVSSEPGDTVTVELSGPNVSGNRLLLDNGNVTVDFTSSTGSWDGIFTDTSFYIGGTMSVTSGATGDNPLNEGITITVTSESIS